MRHSWDNQVQILMTCILIRQKQIRTCKDEGKTKMWFNNKSQWTSKLQEATEALPSPQNKQSSPLRCSFWIFAFRTV